MPPETQPPPSRPDAPLVEPAPWQIPWWQIGGWIGAVFVVAWALVLMPGVVRDVRLWAGIDMPDETLEIPPFPDDPVLLPKVVELMAKGKAAERDGQLVKARAFYFHAWKAQTQCFSCALHRRRIERLIREESIESLGAGARYLEEARYEEAAGQFRRVLALVPDEKANYHVLAADGLAKAKAASKRLGRPLP